MRAGARAALAAIALALVVTGCGKRATEDVRATVDGGHLVLENRSNTDIHFQLIEPLFAFIPLSTPNNRLEDGKTLKLRISPSQRGTTLDMAWWRPGNRIAGSELRGPDRVRRIRVKLVELTEPLPPDEEFVRACIALAATTAREQRERPGGTARDLARSYSGPKAEDDCMKRAEQLCPDTPAQCAGELATTRASLVQVEEALARHREEPTAAKAGDDRRSGALEVVAKEAFYDLREGKIDRYVARMCDGTRKLNAGPFMRGLLANSGQDFAQRGVELGRVTERAADHVTFDAVDAAMLTGRAPAVPPLKVTASFQRNGDRVACSRSSKYGSAAARRNRARALPV
jgi:hypothetical protein